MFRVSSFRFRVVVQVAALAPAVCGPISAQPLQKNVIRFDDLTDKSGITFRHTDGGSGQHYIVEVMSGGVALFDYDRDGDVDIYFLNGSRQPTGDAPVERATSTSPDPTPPRNALYRNDGDWKFTDVTTVAGVGDRGHGLGVTVGDYDNDGDQDLYLNNFGPNVLYRNNGDGTFSDVTQQAGLANGNRVGAGTCFADIDADGDLDLYVANYVKFSYKSHVPRSKQGYAIYGSPADYPPDSDSLFRNNGDGTFTDISHSSGIDAVAAPSMGMICTDYDNDGDTDIFVANDGAANFLFENDGHGAFTEIGLLRGFSYDASGKVHASMGIDVADFNHDSYADVHVTSFQGEVATLYRNAAGALLEDVTLASRAGSGTLLPVTWGNGFADFDQDGWKDIFIACGHLNKNVQRYDQAARYDSPNVLLRNVDGERFADVSQTGGEGLQVAASSRGLGLDDLDNDGDVDIVILNANALPTLLMNRTETKHHWLSISLQGTRSNRDGVGAKVEVVSQGLNQSDEVHSGRGYQGHFGSRLHFGLGDHTVVDRVTVRWIGGTRTELQDVACDQHIVIREETTTSR
ncbi:MAG: CRTAC1 family protein [Pirellulaceae bacterium]|nr:CRTAC1 family protein [Planctomycetales bacterium]